jgi:TPP-dependent pyruvate/acetoin dehydrogenase alpha subunit
MSRKSAKKKSADKAPALISDQKLQQLYATMLKCRILESHARSLHGGRSRKWQEAMMVGTTIDLQPEDTLVHVLDAAVARFLKSLPLNQIFPSHKSNSGDAKDKKKSIAGASAQGAIATGIAYARSTENKGGVTLAFLSENPAGCDAGRDALQFARTHKLPIIYVYAGPPVQATQTYAYGFPMIPVDGGDVIAVYRVAYECMIRARQGSGPSVIACNFGSNDGNSAGRQDPLRSMEKYLSSKDLFTDERKQAMIRKFEQGIAQAMLASKKRRGTELESHQIFLM